MLVWQKKKWSNPDTLDKRITLPQDTEIIYLGGLEKVLDKTEVWRG